VVYFRVHILVPQLSGVDREKQQMTMKDKFNRTIYPGSVVLVRGFGICQVIAFQPNNGTDGSYWLVQSDSRRDVVAPAEDVATVGDPHAEKFCLN